MDERTAWNTVDTFARSNWSSLPDEVQADLTTIAQFVESGSSFPGDSELNAWTRVFKFAQSIEEKIPTNVVQAVETLQGYAMTLSDEPDDDIMYVRGSFDTGDDVVTPNKSKAPKSVKGWLARISAQLDEIIGQG